MTSALRRSRSETLRPQHLRNPELLANPNLLSHRVREKSLLWVYPVSHHGMATRHPDAVAVLHDGLADQTSAPARIKVAGLFAPDPIAGAMVKQLLFPDGGAPARLRRHLLSAAVSPCRVERLRARRAKLTHDLLDRGADCGRNDRIQCSAGPLPAIATRKLIASGVLTPFRNPSKLQWLRENLGPIASAVEEIPLDETSSQATVCLARDDVKLCENLSRKRQAAIGMMAGRAPKLSAPVGRVAIGSVIESAVSGPTRESGRLSARKVFANTKVWS